ncbi:MAG: hypothetical protein WCK05_11650, partial [Planctomycetota bacterium]
PTHSFAHSVAIGELEQAARAADPAAVLVERHIISRIIKRDRGLVVAAFRVPHERCYWITRDALVEMVAPEELNVPDIRQLPETVILLSSPDLDSRSPTPLAAALAELERQLFHARVHLAIERRLSEGRLTEARVRQRIHRIGQTEFDEVRLVLRRENLLFPPRDNVTVYAEFAAVYLELRHFARHRLGRYFPTIWHPRDVDAILADDVDVAALLSACRIEGAAVGEESPVDSGPVNGSSIEPECRAPLSPVRRARLSARADQVCRAGNAVRAAILHTRAAPPSHGHSVAGGNQAASAALGELVRRLGCLFDFDAERCCRLGTALHTLLPGAARGYWPREARLLYDLQKACIYHERPLFSVDAVQWLLALGRRPLQRPLPVKRNILIVRRLRGAMAKLAGVRLDERVRQELLALLGQAVSQCEDRLQQQLHGLIGRAMEDVALVSDSVPEAVARDKIIDELIDDVSARGFLTMGDLRDAVSRNNLKLADIGGRLPRRRGASLVAACLVWLTWFLAAVGHFVRGSKLLRLDRQLAFTLDGAYHRGEVYMRWLHRLSQLAFGTMIGRLLTRFAVVPFGGAYIILEGIGHLAHLLIEPFVPVDMEVTGAMLLGLGLYLMALLNLPAARSATRWLCRGTARVIRLTLLEGPRWLVARPILRRVLTSRPFWLFRSYVLAPLPLALLAGGILRLRDADAPLLWAVSGGVFLLSCLLLNTRRGRQVQDLTGIWLVQAWHYMGRNILWGTLQVVIEVFQKALEGLERLLYTVDEWLRFQGDGSGWTLWAKSVLSVPWFFVSYVIRFAVNLLIEPQVNPTKHFPVVTVSHKLLLPTIPSMSGFLAEAFGMTNVAANTAATGIVASIPGFFGFLAWELLGDWRLFQANRPRTLSRLAVGSHGESMVRLMRPGLHSGTLPKLYARMRHAEARAAGDARAAARLCVLARKGHHVEQSIRRFAQRELVQLLTLSRGWGGQELTVGEVRMGSNRIAVELLCPNLPGEPLWIAFEEQSG